MCPTIDPVCHHARLGDRAERVNRLGDRWRLRSNLSLSRGMVSTQTGHLSSTVRSLSVCVLRHGSHANRPPLFAFLSLPPRSHARLSLRWRLAIPTQPGRRREVGSSPRAPPPPPSARNSSECNQFLSHPSPSTTTSAPLPPQTPTRTPPSSTEPPQAMAATITHGSGVLVVVTGGFLPPRLLAVPAGTRLPPGVCTVPMAAVAASGRHALCGRIRGLGRRPGVGARGPRHHALGRHSRGCELHRRPGVGARRLWPPWCHGGRGHSLGGGGHRRRRQRQGHSLLWPFSFPLAQSCLLCVDILDPCSICVHCSVSPFFHKRPNPFFLSAEFFRYCLVSFRRRVPLPLP